MIYQELDLCDFRMMGRNGLDGKHLQQLTTDGILKVQHMEGIVMKGQDMSMFNTRIEQEEFLRFTTTE